MGLFEDVTLDDITSVADKFITTPEEERQLAFEKKKQDLQLKAMEAEIVNSMQQNQPSNSEYTSSSEDTENNGGGLDFNTNQILIGAVAIIGLLVVVK